MKMFLKTEKQFIDGNNPIEVTLDKALNYINEHPSDAECADNFIGFENEQGKTIQFIKFEDGTWIIDVPVLKNGVYSYSEQNNDLNTLSVKEIIKRFNDNQNWRSLCNLVII